ncbi:MAG: EAL domain-containing protein [Pseudomonadota bacterium]|nr:EAL domain-containing protein [Pseudomonadota bacterium]
MLRPTDPIHYFWRSRWGKRAASLFPLGISARLGGALVAVAVLATTANVIISKNALLIRTSTVSSGLAPTVAPTVIPTVAPRIIVEAVAAAPPPDPVARDAFRAEIDRFDSIARRRADAQSKEANTDYAEAAAKLRVTFAAFRAAENKSFAANKGRHAAIARTLDAFIAAGSRLVRAGDQIRLDQGEYAIHLDAMDKRIEESLDHAWHIFGRVIARQSLIKLRGDLNGLRQAARESAAEDWQTPRHDASLASGEQTVREDLTSQQGSLSSAPGAHWLSDMRGDLDALVAAREDMGVLVESFAAISADVARNHAALLSQTKSSGIIANPVRAVNSAPPLQNAALSIPAAPLQSPSKFPALSPHEAVQQSILTQPDSRARALLETVTAIVMLVMVTICVFTVRSVLLPIRKILRATHHLANGNQKSRVTPGGIRELATLAAAFNDMADRLEVAQSHARDQQESLEAQVIERTHRLQQLAEKDPLTSLSNRRDLFGRLNEAIERAANGGGCVGVYFLDIDNFKNYNDSLGHVFGDRVLMSTANRLEEITEGIGFVARFGGDEFTVVYENADGLESIREFGLRLVSAFQQLLPVDERELSLSVSVGASAFPLHAQDAHGLLRAADAALFRAKELGRSQIAVFTPTLAEAAAVRFSTEQGLRRALERGEFELLYQPEIDLTSFDMSLVEALLRWRMPDGRLARPGEFLAIAEQSGLIVDINEWVLRTAVQAAAEWHKNSWPNARVAVNITPRQLLDERFTDRVLNLLQEFDLPVRCLELELTESVLQTGPTTIAALRKLQSNGIAIALDDFGTGYSSLTSLEQLPLSRIKLDQSLIAAIDTSARSVAIVTAILDLCAGLGLEVTVEGIERPDQFAWLLRQRNLYLQGYLISEPVPSREIAGLKTSLAGKMQDLLLTLTDSPAPPRELPLVSVATGIARSTTM